MPPVYDRRTASKRRRNAHNRIVQAVRMAILSRDGFRCVYCGRRGKSLRIDHRLPVSRGGEATFANLSTACEDCDGRKGTMTAEEFQALPRGENWRTDRTLRP